MMRFEGRRRVLLNLHPDGPGGVHDDNYARSLGFRRALVPGEAVAEAVMPAIVHRFGTRWMEGGWLSLKLIGPTYVDEEIREIGESIDDHPDTIDVRVVTEDGRTTLVGKAGLGTTVPWRREDDGTRGAEIAFPAFTLGEHFPRLLFIHDKAEVAVCRDAGGDETPWFRGSSPWGGPVSPPIVLFATVIHIRDAKVGRQHPATLSEIFAEAQARRAAIEERRLLGMDLEPGGLAVGRQHLKHLSGMHVQMDLAVHRPMFQEEPYIMSAHLADKGVSGSGRTWFFVTEFEVCNAEGVLFAQGRNRAKVLLERG